jgi:hypothetical protein
VKYSTTDGITDHDHNNVSIGTRGSGSSSLRRGYSRRTSLATSREQTSREFALKKIVKCRREVGRLLVTESTCLNLITYWTLQAEIIFVDKKPRNNMKALFGTGRLSSF